MSAYTVSDKTISGMLQVVRLARCGVGVYWSGESYRITSDNLNEVGQKLVNENYRSVNCRYDEDTKPHEFSVVPLSMAELTPVQIIKLCDCYSYQSCETDDWKLTEAFAIYDALRGAAIAMLPGYEDAPWGL